MPVPSSLVLNSRDWQHATGYGRRNHVETTTGRPKRLIGPWPRIRSLPVQQGETATAAAVPNRMIRVARPVSVSRT